MEREYPGRPVFFSIRFQCLILLALAIAARAVGLGFGLPHAVARPDEESIVGSALVLEDSEDWNPKFFSYPSLMIYASYGAFKVMHAAMAFARDTEAETLNGLFLENPACFHWTIRLLSLTCGSLTVLAVFASARRLFGLRTAQLSGLILALCYLHVRDSHFGTTDVPFVLIACLSFWQLTKAYSGDGLRHWIFASILAGLAMGTKYTGAWMAWPFAVALARIVLLQTPARRLRTFGVMASGGLLCKLAAFAVSSPYFFLDFDRAWRHFKWEVLLVNVEAPIVEGINGYAAHFQTALWYGLGWPVLLVALAGGVAMALRRDGRGLLLWILPVSFYLYSGSSNRIFIRYMDFVVPFLAIACAWAVRSVIAIVWRGWGKGLGGRTTRLGLPVGVVLFLLAPSIWRICLFDQRMARTDTRLILRQWLLENVPSEEPILWSGGWSAMPHMIHHQPTHRLHATEKVLENEQRLPVSRYRWVVLVQWPVAYYFQGRAEQERASIEAQTAGRYERVLAIDADKADLPPESVSRLDHFYMSFARPGIIARPGPGFQVYRRID